MKTEKIKRYKKAFNSQLPRTLHSEFVLDLNAVLAQSLSEAPLNRDLSFKFEYQAASWMSKFFDPKTGSKDTLKSAAISKWLLAEERNLKTNSRLLLDDTTFRGGVTSQQLKKFARMVIRQTIGETVPESVYSLCKFTNGASTRVKRAPDAISRKFVGEAHATPKAAELFKTKVLPSSPAWVSALLDGSFRIVEQPGSMMFTVPKNAEIDRVACKEPEINMYLQRGAGLYLRSALKKRGINLQDQTLNQRLAYEGSVTRKLATLDLSSASDLISTQLVYDLLPLDWFTYLNDIRVERVLIDGVWHELNMFSSMGNGFTFELESLIFYALSCAINRAYGVRGRVSVYGDDIITPSAIAGSYVRIFAWFGFRVNPKKSFWTGSFRESCGKHYYDGTDVTPFYLKSPVLCMTDLIHQLNQLRKWGTRNGDDFWTPKLFEFWTRWASRLPKFLWGGKDTEDKSCLATNGRSRKRLTASKREIATHQLGAYLQWLHSVAYQPVRLVSLRCDDTAPFPIKREIALFWLVEYDRREPLVTSCAVLDLNLEVTRNRSWGRSLDPTLWWFQEDVVMTSTWTNSNPA